MLAVHLLGNPRVLRDGQPLPAPRGHKVWGLLAYLAGTGPADRRHLAALLFEDAEDPLAALRWNLSELRRLLGDAAVQSCSDGIRLDPALYIDVKVLDMGSWSQALHVPDFDRELLEGMSFAGSPSFDVWIAGERRHLLASAEAVLREAALARLAVGAAHDAADLAGRLVRRNPLDENYQALLVRSLSAAGDGVGAARQVAACRALFQRELGIEPGPTLDAALRTVTALPVSQPATGRAAAIAQIEAGEAAIGAGALEAGLQCLRRAVVDADATTDNALRARARIALGGALVHAARGRDEEGATALHEALAVGQNVSPLLAAAASRELGYIEFLRGRYDRATVWLDSAAAFASGDDAERARVATMLGSVLSDTAHYAAALRTLREAVSLATRAGDLRQTAFALSMLGRTHLLRGELEPATDELDRALAIAQQSWTAFAPWPQSLRADIDLLRGEVDSAADRFEHAFALGCQLGDPCWQCISGRGRGCVALARGDPARAAELVADGIARCTPHPDAYLWAKAYALDALCGVAVAHAMPHAPAWIDQLQALADERGMREMTVRAHLHRAALGDATSGAAARLLAADIDNPRLHAACGVESSVAQSPPRMY